MSTHPRRFRYLVGALATGAVAAASIVLAPVGAASAATTSMALASIPTTPTAGQQVTMQTYVIASDGSTPAGSVDVRVEGFSFIVGGPINTATHEASTNIGNFKKGAIVVDATFTPTNPLYSSSSTRTTVNIAGLNTLSIRPVFPSPLVVGTPVKVSVLMSVGSGTAFPPGGVVGFAPTGTVTSTGTCTPAATGSSRNFSCSATLPAPTKAGPYSITATFGRSEYYNNTSGTTATTVTAKPIHKNVPVPVKKTATTPTSHATASAPATLAGPTPSATPTNPPTTSPVTNNAAAAAPKTAATSTSPAGPWEWLFLGALVLLIAATIVILLALRRRRATT